MLCDACHKNEATVHLTQIVDNQMKTVDLCEPCSKAKGVDDPAGFSLAGILLGLSGATAPEPAAAQAELQCSHCGFTLADLKKSGRLGCSRCYTVFSEPLHSLLKSMHKGVRHTGKVPHQTPQSTNLKDQIQKLQTELDEAVRAEQYEHAAALRDQIKQLRQQLNPASHA
ncbi:MAG TPA: UvrB/UvrC motif-containing protein [Candidatus Paceibacterota bacterium]|nr:UvrB/UvrC motif-containing protein [Verrucomicrobiota bacterium]HOX00748.1 UvrB/UvrC motif-containing protein [Verrucomicrobiota bacterium]HRZ45728.1 UvrB/UvrC motif-containing protein [Candidatus Paceibacterota bacterium]HRZ92957.1 UvrB/UvrC motif-containing protein [Candidatus Paceibacterota bacterium]